MSDSRNDRPGRREFISSVAAAAAVVAGTAGTAWAAPLGAGGVTSSRDGGEPPFDDTWTARVKAAAHRGVFDSPDLSRGMALQQASTYMDGYKEMFGATGDAVVAVVVMRHLGTALALSDAMWAAHAFGARFKLDDPLTGKPALRNPFLTVSGDEEKEYIGPHASLPALRARGAVLLACNKALMSFATDAAKKAGRDVDEVKAEFRAGVVPGVILQPSGVYATMRAQEAGCGFIRAG